jgi:hypothetical protein
MKLQSDGKEIEASRVVVQTGEVLDNEVVVVALERNFKDHRAAHPGKVLYAWPELPIVKDLRENAPEVLRQVHELKREFDGWIDPRGYEVDGKPFFPRPIGGTS